MTYETDDEKVEAIKTWWKDNGLSVAGGIVLGLALIFGWRAWVDHRERTAAAASALFTQLLTGIEQSDPIETSRQQAGQLRDDHDGTPYAMLGQLALARALYTTGDAAGAVAALEQAIARAPDPALARVAALRLARIQVDRGELDAAAAILDAHDTEPAFAGDFAAIRGDLAAARGDPPAARAAYERALASGTGLSELTRLKLDNLPAAPAP